MQNELKSLSDSQLLSTLQELNDKEHEATLQILLYLIEVENRRLYAEEGCSSMFTFCTDKLKYSKGAAHRRTQSARVVRDYPVAYRLLKARKVNLITLTAIRPILTKENSHQVFSSIIKKTQEEVEAYVSSYKPRSQAPRETIKPLSIKGTPEARQQSTGLSLFAAHKSNQSPTPQIRPTSGAAHKPSESLMADPRFDLRFSVDKNTMDKLNRARRFMKFKAAGSLEQTFDALLDFFLRHKDPVRKAERRTARSQRANIRKITRHIPSRTKEEVFAHGNGRCEYVSPAGKRCNETRHLEYDHVRPFAAGGSHDTENLRLLCPTHNRHTAEKVFGKRYQTVKEKLNRYRATKNGRRTKPRTLATAARHAKTRGDLPN